MVTPTCSALRIGIDLGGTKTEGILMDADGAILARERRVTPRQQGYRAILECVRGLVLDLERQAGRTCAVGIGTPGSVSARTGLLKNSNTTCLNGQPVQSDLEAMLQRPVRIANDANCFALSEAIDGAGHGRAVVFGVIIGTGVGGGIVVRGELLQGLQHIAGEWGHNPLEPDGPACYCGRQGCIETLLSGPGLERDYVAQGPSSGVNSVLQRTQGTGGPALAGVDAGPDARTIAALAQGGDERAEAAMRRYLARFGRALASVINILDPDAVILGGGLSNIPRLYDEGREQVARHVFNDELRTLILPNVHGDSSGVRGAARLWAAGETPRG
ncbi:MAG: ROK family protein [Gammaproteobacteria bacterium]|nr:ROK family protein [Gammaproteobacteria bacterium]